MRKESYYTKYEIVELRSTIFRTPRVIVSTDQALNHCTHCAERLERYHALIPVGNGMAADIPGSWCRKCDKLYAGDGDSVRKILKDNPLAKGYTLDGEELWDYTNTKRRLKKERKSLEKIRRTAQERLDRLSEISSSEVMICVCFDDGLKLDCIIASNPAECNDTSIFHYSSETGREYLSAAFAQQRKNRGVLHGKPYRVISKIYPPSKYGKMAAHIIPTALNIRPGGGYFRSVGNARSEIVDTLLYSLRSNRYEILRSTLDKTIGECYVDIDLFRDYVKKNGRSAIAPDFGYRSSFSSKNFDDLKPESVLKGYGYSVSKTDGISLSQRRELLAEIVDLEILSVKDVVSLLDFFIRTRTNSAYAEARYKWQSDKKFIQEYRVNPQRFMIAELK